MSKRPFSEIQNVANPQPHRSRRLQDLFGPLDEPTVYTRTDWDSKELHYHLDQKKKYQRLQPGSLEYQRRSESEPPLPDSQLPDPHWDPQAPFTWPVVPRTPRVPTPLSQPALSPSPPVHQKSDSNLESQLLDHPPLLSSPYASHRFLSVGPASYRNRDNDGSVVDQKPSQFEITHSWRDPAFRQTLNILNRTHPSDACPFCVPVGHESFASLFRDPAAKICDYHRRKAVWEVQMNLLRLGPLITHATNHRDALIEERESYHQLLEQLEHAKPGRN
ncbi:hypothetical protein CC1G_02867 [Coprinopsis cinerea okayama7|uniref:Uncharacterized protein n=1 Tax=Coprinopsis cinerea (strain Okayama-7 / 130 / ATCC MYA-4618 / FGSC 9003) TaxID=240176 RepID=A8N098_COPC7|nr:hypothetical protein CC1G_02867 [Coprinopsis cinerea okayama7\|eukprot:XP_001828286.1 hypothetical protein CC1G_02867 [Coprinopsis cinerea okayama7\